MDWQGIVNRFEAFQRASNLSERTIGGRTEVLQRLARTSGVQPQEVQLEHMIEFLNRDHARTGRPLAAGTKQVERSYLQCWGRWMHEEGLTVQNHAARLPRVKVPRRQARPIYLEHVMALLELDVWQSTKDLIAVLANTGLRVGEAVRIRGEDYDPIGKTLRAVRKGGLVHILRLPQAMVELAQRMPREGWWFPSTYVSRQFPEGGGHILMKSASTKIGHALRKIGIKDPKITGHSLRHFYACMLLANGTPIHVVQEMLGHASLATTQLYILVRDEEIRDAVQLIPRIDSRDSEMQGVSHKLVA